MSTEREIQQLVDELPNRTELGFEMFTHLIRQGWLTDITLAPHKWMSESNAVEKRIELGTGHMSTDESERLVFGNLSQNDMKIQRFMHEMGHLFIRNTKGAPDTENLGNSTHNIRRGHAYKRGLSAVGSLGFYPENERWEEDSAELIAMRLKSVSYLGSFAAHIANRSNEAELRRVGIAGVSEKTAAAIITITDRAISPIKL